MTMEGFLAGLGLASLLWLGVLGWQMVSHWQELREVESTAFEEGWRLKQRNNLLERGNKNLTYQYDRYRSPHRNDKDLKS